MTQPDPEQNPYGAPPQYGPPQSGPPQYGPPQSGPPAGAPPGQPPYGAPPNAFYPQQPYFYPQPETHGSAITALVLGLVSIVVSCGFFTGIPAMILGRKAMREIDESQGRLTGRGLAQAGFWTGLVGTIIMALIILLYVGIFVFAIVMSSSTGSTSPGNV